MIQKTFNWIFNSNPLLEWVNGYKTQIAGAIAGAALVVDFVAPFTPIDIGLQLTVVSVAMKQIAGYLGFVGVVGKLAKPAQPELVVVPSGEAVS